ncbi:MAG: Hsp20/alpha crystallin family protein [Methanomicrobiales archaeon]|nr:Hsp20/alpha crystallin family protein [Methanomicrobiales archaeon]
MRDCEKVSKMNATKVSPTVCAMPDEEHENLHIEIELPGVDKEDVILTMHDDSFTVRARRNDIEYVGSYALCCPVDYEEAKSRFHNGLLTIDVPYQKPQMRGKKIAIE